MLSHEHSRGLGAALRAGLEIARDEGYAAAVYLDGDGEYDPADFARVLDPVARGRADYVIGSRFLGPREGMSWHRTLANRIASAVVGFLRERWPATPSPATAPSPPARSRRRASGMTTTTPRCSPCRSGGRIEPVEVPISYSRRTSGRSFVRYPEYLVRVAPAVWREWRASRATRRSRSTPPDRAREPERPGSAVEVREQPGQRPERRVRPPATSAPPKKRASA